MAKLLVILIGILPNLLFGQYTYFNKGYLPPYPEIGSGESSNLFIRNDSLIVFGFAPSPDDDGSGYDFVWYLFQIDPEGTLDTEILIQNNDNNYFTGYSDNVSFNNPPYVASTGNGNLPSIIWFDNEFNILQQIDYNTLYSDYSYGTFTGNQTLNDSSTISYGRLIYDLDLDSPGISYTNLLLCKHDNYGNEIWFHEYSPSDLEIEINEIYQFIPWGGIKLLANNNFILWLTIRTIGNSDCYAIKFNSQGEYLDHVKWGNPNYGEGSPWPVQISDSTFKFVFGSYSSGMGEILANHPIVGTLNANDMTVSLFPVIDHDYYYGLITDFERTPDGGYAILYYGTTDPAVNARAFLVKTDEDGVEEWYKEYLPPEPYDTPTAYDLEITSDGGFAFVGNYHPQTDDVYYYKTWVVKTDACGELMDTGCPPTIGVDESNPSLVHMKVYPNPANNELHATTSVAGVASAMLFDITGRKVWQTATPRYDQEFIWDIGALPPALYTLVLLNSDGVRMATAPVVKK
jgi:hypothetical protein